jgi:hypothetical protein
VGYYKQLLIEQQDSELNQVAGRRAARVSGTGGDSMANSFLAQLDALISGAAAEPEPKPVAAAPASEPPASEPPALAAPVADDSTETPAQKLRRLELSKPIVGAISTEKMVHGSMILNGICSNCVCCGMPLTDAVSVQRATGPSCSSKGYAEDPTNPDEMGAMIELAEYPALVDFLTQHYKPLGVRGLMNGLVRIACLNRKTPVHTACCNAVDMLGYDKLASMLRNGLVIGQIKDSKNHPGSHHVWIKRANWTREFGSACGRIPHAFFSRPEKGWIVPKHPASKTALWLALIEHFSHEAIKTDNGPVKIPTMEEYQAKRAQKAK